jgi:5-methyltetrahydropteroyltriglutamate--homocysteine methyltransferase
MKQRLIVKLSLGWLIEVDALAKALAGQKDETFFAANAVSLASRRASPRVTNEAVEKFSATLKTSDHHRVTPVND